MPAINAQFPGHFHRIMIIGCAGSGKSTLALALGDILHLPIVHIDRIFWLPGWNALPPTDLDRRLLQEYKKEAWIVDGNYSRTLLARLESCDAVIFLDFPRWICLRNVFLRYFQYRRKPRPDLTEGCPEKIDLVFLRWIWNFNKTHRQLFLHQIQESGKPSFILHSRSEVINFLASLREEGS